MSEDAKRDARARFEARRRASRRWGGRGREGTGEGRRARANGDGREVDARRSSAPSARVDDDDARVELDAGGDAVVARGADLEELLRDAALASLPRPRNAATYFDASWSVDSLREMERELGLGSSAEASDAVVARALTVDRDALKERLSLLSAARLLDLGAEYEYDDDGVGVTRDDERTHRATSSRTNDDAHASVVPSQPPPTRKAVDVAPPSVDDEDDWLDDLLNDG